ncbi:MAG: TIGR02391 family protein [Desulfarculaceae bacterium]|nr:TIGR02391 family protein [Desulfarculaceae bacterium]
MNSENSILKLAGALKKEVDSLGLSGGARSVESDWDQLFDGLIKDKGLRRATISLYRNKHYTQAVESSFKYLNSYVRKKTGRKLDGAQLMQNVFSAKNPVLKLSNLDGKSGDDAQRGYMDIFCGCITGIRNPRAHEDAIDDDPETALEIIYFVHHLVRITKMADKIRD